MSKQHSILVDYVIQKNILYLAGYLDAMKLLLRLSSEASAQEGRFPACVRQSGRVRRSYHCSAKLFTTHLSFVCCALFLLIIFSSCENDPRDIDNWTKRAELREEGKIIESYLSQGGALRARLTAPQMYRYHRDTLITEFPQSLHVDFYDDSVRVESWLTSRYGIYYENLNKVFLRDSVTVINTEGDTLRCPELWWDQNQQKFYTDKPARLDGKDKHITGTQGLEATQDLKVIEFKYPTGPFQVKEGNLPE
jgi:LPS export ABC transporter protein LptC